VYWIHVAQDRVQWCVTVNTIMNLQFPQKEVYFLTSLATISSQEGLCTMGLVNLKVLCA
jgi:hypothetical protein